MEWWLQTLDEDVSMKGALQKTWSLFVDTIEIHRDTDKNARELADWHAWPLEELIDRVMASAASHGTPKPRKPHRDIDSFEDGRVCKTMLLPEQCFM